MNQIYMGDFKGLKEDDAGDDDFPNDEVPDDVPADGGAGETPDAAAVKGDVMYDYSNDPEVLQNNPQLLTVDEVQERGKEYDATNKKRFLEIERDLREHDHDAPDRGRGFFAGFFDLFDDVMSSLIGAEPINDKDKKNEVSKTV